MLLCLHIILFLFFCFFRGDTICSKYDYKVRYTGVGQGPTGTEHLGTCTQIAVFERLCANENLVTGTERMEPYIVVGKG